MPAEYENHHPNHPLYVSENVRLCAGCSGQFELGAFNGLNSGNDSRRLRRICRTCERNEEQDQAVSQAGKALANAANLIAKPRFAGSDGAPLARTVMNATLARLYQAEQKAGRLENGESSGEQVLASGQPENGGRRRCTWSFCRYSRGTVNMKKFETFTGIVAGVDRANIDTDALIPK